MARHDTPLTLTPANTRRFPDGGNRNRPEPLRLDALARFHQLRLHGLARAKAESQEQRRRRGKKAIGRPQVSAKTEEAIRDHLRDGIGHRPHCEAIWRRRRHCTSDQEVDGVGSTIRRLRVRMR